MNHRFSIFWHALMACVLAASLAACGGSEDALVDRYQLSAIAYANENHMPHTGDIPPACLTTYVWYQVENNSGRLFPADFAVARVTLSKEGSSAAPWLVQPDAREAYFPTPTTFQGVASACSANFITGERYNDFAVGDHLIVTIHLTGDGREDEIQVRSVYLGD